ncbi:MAG: hypothetical protein JWM19_2539 [Actinomycetia bacterium]|nr:hypothetical protein [Actinomycetes bacterium]
MMLAEALSAAVCSRRCALDEKERLSKGAFTPFLTIAGLMDSLQYSLITTDYLTVFREGVRAPLRGLTSSRQVLNKRLDGFVEAEPVMALYAEGNTLQFRSIDHWKLPVQDFLSHHARFPGAETLASAYVVPPRARPMDAHSEGAHLFILQLDGRQDVLMGDPGAHAVESPAYLPFDGMPTRSFALEPGDLLHVPHGWPHRSETADEASLHLALSVRYPGTEQIVTALNAFLLEGIESSSGFLAHHRIPPREKSQQVLTLLADLLTGIDPAEIARRAEAQ